jgi:cyclase
MRAKLLTAIVVIGMLLTAVSAAQRGPRQKVRSIQRVKNNLYLIAGSDVNTYPIPGTAYSEASRTMSTGGNVAVLVTENNGVVLVDTMNPGFGPDIFEQVRSVTDKPITMILNTHAHADHTGSNAEFMGMIEYVVQENTLANMTRLPIYKDDKAKFLPKRTFKDKITLLSGRDRIDMYYFGRGHTDGDTWIVFPALRVLHTGDMFQRKNLPLVDVNNNNGNALEFVQTLQKASTTIRGIETVIPGHSPTLMTWDDFKEYIDFYDEFVSAAQASMKAGKTVDEAAAAYKPSAKFRNYEVEVPRVKQNIQSIYDSSPRNGS